MSTLRTAGNLLIAWFVACGMVVAVALLAVGALGFGLGFVMCMIWDWLEERTRGY